MSNTIKVGIGDLNVARNGDILVTYALGSCVGICIFDSVRKIAGMSHIMLPDSAGFNPTGLQIYKFADLAIPALVEKMESLGSKKICMRAKIAGGAKMFANVNNSALANIGERNVAAVKEALTKLRIPIMVEDTGANYGRTQFFTSVDGTMTIKSVNRGEKVY